MDRIPGNTETVSIRKWRLHTGYMGVTECNRTRIQVYEITLLNHFIGGYNKTNFHFYPLENCYSGVIGNAEFPFELQNSVTSNTATYGIKT
jgi:hypothetical protein